MAISIETLNSLCGDPCRETVSKPFSFQFEGSWWDAATNGHAIVCSRQGSGELARDYSPPAQQLLKSEGAKPTHRASFFELVKWLNAVEKTEPCKACRATGKHVCDCHYCEVLDGTVCPECCGDKCFPLRLEVTFGKWRFDRVLAARYLSPFVDSGKVDVFFGGALDPFEFRGPDWRVLIMPMMASDTDKSTGDVPEELIEQL
jgi:hypothetical protein